MRQIVCILSIQNNIQRASSSNAFTRYVASNTYHNEINEHLDALLNEDGSFILNEDGSRISLE